MAAKLSLDFYEDRSFVQQDIRETSMKNSFFGFEVKEHTP